MNNLNKEIQFVKGIGPKRAEKLQKLNIFTLKDLIYYFPRQYEDRSVVKKISQLENEDKVSIKGIIVKIDTYSPKKGMKITRMDIRDESGYIKMSFFNQEYIIKVFKSGDSILAFGKVKVENNFKEFIPIEVEHYTNKPTSTCKIEPVYPLTYGLSNKELQGMIRTVLVKEEFKVEEYLPTYLLEKYKLCGIDFAIRNIHSPSSKEALKIALYSNDNIGAVSPVTNSSSYWQSIPTTYKTLNEMQEFAYKINISDKTKWEERIMLVGYSMLIKKEVLDKVGLLDEIYFPGNFEDDDYCFRIINAEYKLLLCHDTFVHHYGSASFSTDSSYNEILQKNKRKFS